MIRGFEVIASVLVAFFVAGIVMGMLLVVTLPLIKIQFTAFRAGLRRSFGRRKYMDGDVWKEPELPAEDDEKPPWYRR
jgi:hypothetical protein